MEYSIESFGNKQMLKIKCLGCKYSSSIADSPQCMQEVIDLLRKYAPDIIVLSSLYNKTYSKQQVDMLKEIANVANEAEALGLWSLKLIKTKDKEFSKIIAPLQSKIVETTHHKLLEDPILAYTELLKLIKTLKDAGIFGSGILLPLIIASKAADLPMISSDFIVRTSLKVYAAPCPNNAQTSISPNL